MKKIMAIILTLAMALALPATAFAADTVTIYFDNTAGWSSVSAYYWSWENPEMTAWPGVAMTQVEGTIYAVEVPTAATLIVFNNSGNNSQTGDLTIPTYGMNLYVYGKDEWSFYDGGESGGPNDDGTDDTSIPVNGVYVAGTAAAEKISVDVSWEEMTFTYTQGNQGTWNPATHAYDGATAGGWSANTPAITVANHSNVAVTATLDFAASVDGIVGTFTEASGTANDKVLELATAEGTEVANAPTATANFGISGAAIDADQQLGTITVTIAKQVVNADRAVR